MKSHEGHAFFKLNTSCYDQNGDQLFTSDVSPASFKISLHDTEGFTVSMRGKSQDGSQFVCQEISLKPVIEHLTAAITNFEVPKVQKDRLLEQSEYKRYRSRVVRAEHPVDDEDIFEEFVTKEPLDRSSVQRASVQTDITQLDIDVQNLTEAWQAFITMQSVLKVKVSELLKEQEMLKKKVSNVERQNSSSTEQRYARFFRAVLSAEIEPGKQDELLEKILVGLRSPRDHQ